MAKAHDAFRTISEVADWLGVQAHVLRFWESKFSQVKPVKRAGGRRYYRPTDMQLLGGIKKLLHDDGLTIKGVQKILREQGVAHVITFCQPLEDGLDAGQEVTQDATVLSFRGKRVPSDDAAPETEEAAPEPVEDDLPAAEAVGSAAEPELHDDAPDDPTPELPGFEHVAATTDETPDTAPAKEVVPQDIKPDTATVPDAPPATAPNLPSFMHRDRMANPETDAPQSDETTMAPRARIVDAPDPPSEADLPYTPGLIARLAKLESLDASQAEQIAPVARDLRSWLDRTAGTGTA